ncbi:hypothetical protein CULT_160018 [[Clostridium] ultunense Esp]|nr:hypothetical protein CULT_160018 [[Clostridium] ultunense Esp]
MFVEKWYLILYQTKDLIVYVDDSELQTGPFIIVDIFLKADPHAAEPSLLPTYRGGE